MRRGLLSVGLLLYTCSYRSVTVQVFDLVVGVVVRLVVISGDHSLNFVRNTGYMKIIVEQSVADLPGCIYYSSEKFRLESLNQF